ncbi:LysR substrate-binding domain-containing protein [Paraglaciecola aquimarina]|uniref:LysR substrate-binding domain-containing protein n=1 Tax=Paraglaciecola aquimarina TaxID=1235557 RepID=A0ABU3SZ13_9ALTE|nr:LysR substrate-binding domain-containing protein [Paraglaciecola aquimarina]MDU0355254.1 LysR substrate-binding domain-containing protein [Paraglaciecola aquimarina]
MSVISTVNSNLFDGMAIFVALINHGSFTKTALASGHSTSYISKEINKLEERVGVRLLNRTTRKLSLTPAGKHYFQQCLQIVENAQLAHATLLGQQQEPAGTLKISCPVSFGLSRLQPLLADFMGAYPKVKIELELNDRKVDLVAQGYDLAIRASHKLESSSLISRRLMSSEALVIASPAYIAEYGMPTKPLELIEHKTISYANVKQPNLWQFIDSSGQTSVVNVESHVLTNNSEMKLALCLAGKGITRLPRFNLHGEIESGRLVELFPTYQKSQIDVFLVYPSKRHMSSKVRAFIDFVVTHISD